MVTYVMSEEEKEQVRQRMSLLRVQVKLKKNAKNASRSDD